MGRYYITTTLPYVNAEPHIGFAMEIIRADLLARFHRELGDEVVFNTGTDEHGQKIYQKAVEEGKDPQAYVDEYAAKFERLKEALNLSFTHFIRTTDKKHVEAAVEFWKRVEKNGYIYKAQYKTKYCVGCELEKQDSDLVEGRCPLHPKQELEIREEENYFFKFSAFSDKLLELYKNNPTFVMPDNRLKEIENFVKEGLQDFSISRLKEKMPWGVGVPGDDKHVMYVWFDALVNYISTIGWPTDEEEFNKWWPGVQICGKDNLRQQSAMWQAMLLAADLPASKQILVNGFITGEGGVKMSKSLGNVVNPMEYVERYGTDAVRYYLLSQITGFEDSPFTKEKFEEVYQADLANGLGNLVSRVQGLVNGEGEGYEVYGDLPKASQEVWDLINNYEFDKALGVIWGWIREADRLINDKKVWTLKGEEKSDVLGQLVETVRKIGVNLRPFLPETAEKITEAFSGKIEKGVGMFPRLG